MAKLSEDGDSVELDDGDFLVTAKVNGEVYGQAVAIHEEDVETTELTAKRAVDRLIETIEEKV